MSDSDQHASNSQAVPFFARFLEGQFCEDLSEEEMNAVRGGIASEASDGIVTTLKYPSDNEEGGDGIITKKCPSHNEEGGHGITRKYPSDSDEAFTNKYPSDGDDDFPKDYIE